MTELVRLSKLMAERGFCTRREADDWISNSWVFVDGVCIREFGIHVDPAAKITLASEAQACLVQPVTILLHKPVGYFSCQPEPGTVSALSLVCAKTQQRNHGGNPFKPTMLKGLAPADLLDIEATGLLALTQDGGIAKQLIGEDSDVEKEYIVRVDGKLSANALKLLNHGLSLDDEALRLAQVERLNENQLRFILKQNKKGQIHQMCELVGLKVTGLKRVRIGKVKLADLPLGKWRLLRPNELF